jgi:hypothetical protein
LQFIVLQVVQTIGVDDVTSAEEQEIVPPGELNNPSSIAVREYASI